jgi:hypothetical protein
MRAQGEAHLGRKGAVLLDRIIAHSEDGDVLLLVLRQELLEEISLRGSSRR